jgi:hypothetical protein
MVKGVMTLKMLQLSLSLSLHFRVCSIWAYAVLQLTEAKLVNPLTSRSRVISALGRYNQKCGVVENECLHQPRCRPLLLLLEMSKLLLDQAVFLRRLQAFARLNNVLPRPASLRNNELLCTAEDSLALG